MRPCRKDMPNPEEGQGFLEASWGRGKGREATDLTVRLQDGMGMGSDGENASRQLYARY